MTIAAKFASVCPKCLQPIAVGDRINWTRGMKAEHVICPAPPIHAVNVTPAPAPVLAVVGGIANVVALLSKVSVTGGGTLKAPKMRFLAPDGKSELRLSLAVRPKNPANVGAIYVKIGDNYIGSISANGSTRISDAALLTTLTNIGNDPAAAAKAYGAFAGRCSFCGLELTDEGSVEVGYGPICAANYGLPHKAMGTPKVKTVGTVAPAPTLAAFAKSLPDAPSEPLSYGKSAEELTRLTTPKAPKPVTVVDGIRIVDVDE